MARPCQPLEQQLLLLVHNTYATLFVHPSQVQLFPALPVVRNLAFVRLCLSIRCCSCSPLPVDPLVVVHRRKTFLHVMLLPPSNNIATTPLSSPHHADPLVVHDVAPAQRAGGVALRFAAKDGIHALAWPPPHLNGITKDKQGSFKLCNR